MKQQALSLRSRQVEDLRQRLQALLSGYQQFHKAP